MGLKLNEMANKTHAGARVLGREGQRVCGLARDGARWAPACAPEPQRTRALKFSLYSTTVQSKAQQRS
jgi:hypothetical protein